MEPLSSSAASSVAAPAPDLYADSYERAAECARMVLPLLARQQLPANPVNFAVFYDYTSGRSRELTDELNRCLAGKEPVTDELTRQLFLRHVCPRDAGLVERLRLHLRRLVEDTLQCVGATGADAGRARESLESHAQRIEQEVGASPIASLVTAVLEETRAIARAERGLAEHLGNTANEVEGLREELGRLRQEATTDTLTGLANRRALDAALRESLEKAAAGQQDLSIALVDIDHFKRVNDSYGHLIGDRVLRLIANQLKACVKGRDLVARFGGEEFAVILPDTPARGAHAVAEAIRKTIEQSRIRRTDTGEHIGTVTVSLGVAQYRHGDGVEDLTRRCDEALYKAKRAGRNRVVVDV